MDEFDEKENKENETGKSDKTKKDEEVTRKVVFCLCYLFGILFFLPLLMYKDDEAKMHANQGLVILLLSVIGNVIFGMLTWVLFVFAWVASIYSLLLFILCIIGVVYVVTDKNEPLPIIGKIKLIK